MEVGANGKPSVAPRVNKLCVHKRVRNQCVQCGGGSICEHKRRRIMCVDCGRSQICEHKRIRSSCKECKTSGQAVDTNTGVGAGPSLACNNNDADVRIARGKRRHEDASVGASVDTAHSKSPVDAVSEDHEGRNGEEEGIANREEDGDDGEEVAEYERRRQANIRRNAGILAGLGITPFTAAFKRCPEPARAATPGARLPEALDT